MKGAVLLGLGSILGTGVFVSIAIGAGLAYAALPLALLVAGFLASCNGLSSAQLAATFPVSGGTYEYANRTIGPKSGFCAGWLFFCAKSASCATAALGCSGYLLAMINMTDPLLIKGFAALSAIVITGLVVGGVKRSSQVNNGIVILTVLSLVSYIVFCLRIKTPFASVDQSIFHTPPDWMKFFEACALMFVAYTGYGRIATLGEEIKNPTRNIPIAIVVTLIVALLLYVGVAVSSLSAIGAQAFNESAGYSGAALSNVARLLGIDWLAALLTVASMVAMIGVELNLILGLSRVLLAMGRRGDLPSSFGRLNSKQSPVIAILATGAFVVALILLLDFRASWSFSAFTVLIYYAITNLSALKLNIEKRFVPKWISWIGLVVCLSLSVFVNAHTIAAGIVLLSIGFILRFASRSKSLSGGSI